MWCEICCFWCWRYLVLVVSLWFLFLITVRCCIILLYCWLSWIIIMAHIFRKPAEFRVCYRILENIMELRDAVEWLVCHVTLKPIYVNDVVKFILPFTENRSDAGRGGSNKAFCPRCCGFASTQPALQNAFQQVYPCLPSSLRPAVSCCVVWLHKTDWAVWRYSICCSGSYYEMYLQWFVLI